MKYINSFDLDGVIFMGPGIGGVYPGPDDVIITGRSFEEEVETRAMLESKGIVNQVYYNQMPYTEKTRVDSGYHKVETILRLQRDGISIVLHLEDDEIQAEIIRKNCPSVKVVHLVHDLVNKENARHLEF